MPKSSERQPRAENYLVLEHTFFVFFVFSSLGCVPEGSRSDSGGSGDPPGADFGRILQHFFADSVGIFSKIVGFRRDIGSSRVPPGCRRDLHPTSVTHSAGFPWGTAISRSDLNN